MCGIAGYTLREDDQVDETASHVLKELSHRGPDDSGWWIDERHTICLVHRRLSIVDLSPLGHQPMSSSLGRYVITFNGEIYNYAAIRAELEAIGVTFKGSSDTEVLLEGFERWGIRKTIERTVGMFALAVWDNAQRALTLSRDRIGEKPLYYGWSGGRFFFASELKGLRVHPHFHAELNRDSVALLLKYNYIPAPHSIYRGVYKLPSATLLELKLQDLCSPQGFSPFADDSSVGLHPKRYWSAREIVERGAANQFAGSETEAVNMLEHALGQAIDLQKMADVPVGAFLSGGIDSSTVVALMQARSATSVKTFSIGFYESEYNEAHHAKKVATHLGTDHTELYLNPQDALDVVPMLAHMYDEPFADASQIPTYLVAKLARQKVTVSVSGDGGDELFGGYPRYEWTRTIFGAIRHLPVPSRELVAWCIRRFSPRQWDRVFSVFQRLTPERLNFHNPGHKLHRLSMVVASHRIEQLYARMMSLWDAPHRLVHGSSIAQTFLDQREEFPKGCDELTLLQFLDLMVYLSDDIFVKVDRASMAVSLESRTPFMDQRVIELAFRMPRSYMYRNGKGKWILRQLLYRYVPAELVERPKMGFGIPLDHWLRGPLKSWADELLDKQKMKRQGILDPGPIHEQWALHLEGKHDNQYQLWPVLMFQAWAEGEGKGAF